MFGFNAHEHSKELLLTNHFNLFKIIINNNDSQLERKPYNHN